MHIQKPLFKVLRLAIITAAASAGCAVDATTDNTATVESGLYSPYPGCVCDANNPPSDMTCFFNCLYAPSVTFYEDINFSGASFSTMKDRDFVGWDWNDRISSVRVPPGYTVYLYADWYYGGGWLTLSSDTADLRNYGWNDAASSIRIR